jgi:pSer/pThr/pTyr-binding forkhead associated (FHA) protein
MQPVPPTFGSEPTAPAAPTAASAIVAPLEPDQIPENAPHTLAGFLVSYEAEPLGQFWPLFQGGTLIGRKDAGIGAAIEIDHPTTSSRHAKLHSAARPGRLKVEDLGSTNGTYVNERRLEPGERRTVVHGDSVRFGGFTATVVLL